MTGGLRPHSWIRSDLPDPRGEAALCSQWQLQSDRRPEFGASKTEAVSSRPEWRGKQIRDNRSHGHDLGDAAHRGRRRNLDG